MLRPHKPATAQGGHGVHAPDPRTPAGAQAGARLMSSGQGSQGTCMQASLQGMKCSRHTSSYEKQCSQRAFNSALHVHLLVQDQRTRVIGCAPRLSEGCLPTEAPMNTHPHVKHRQVFFLDCWLHYRESYGCTIMRVMAAQS